jgi:hypothetical protein
LGQLSNAFIRQELQPTLAQMFAVYRHVRAELPSILSTSGAKSVFDGAHPFRDVYLTAASKSRITYES